MQVDMSERSRYVNEPADQVARAFKRNVRLINVVAILAIVILAASYLALRRPHAWNTVVMVFGYVCAFLAAAILKARNWAELTKVVTHDSDPAKLAQVLDVLIPKARGKGSRQTMSALYAMCAALMGYDDVALAWVTRVEAESPKAGVALMCVNTRLAVAKRQEDLVAVQALRAQAAAIEGQTRTNTPAGKNASMVLAFADRHLAFLSGDYVRTRELNGAIEALAATPQSVVASEYNKAELEDALGDVAAAWPHYAFVANNGGTQAIRAVSAAWLDAHDPRNLALAEGGQTATSGNQPTATGDLAVTTGDQAATAGGQTTEGA